MNVKLKKMWKTSNRGVILALLLLLALSIYVVVDKITFNNEKSVIKTTVENYIAEYANYMANTEEFCNGKGEWSDNLYKEKREVITQLLDKYWTDTFYVDSRNPWNQLSKLDINNNIKELYNSTYFIQNKGYIKPIQYSLSDMKITKNGPNGAKVTSELKYKLTYKNPITTLSFSSDLFSPSDYSFTTENEDQSKEQHLTMKLTIEFNLLREKGEWKFSDVRSNGYETFREEEDEPVASNEEGQPWM